MKRQISEETRRRMSESARRRGNSEAWKQQQKVFEPFCTPDELERDYNELQLTQQEIADKHKVTLKRVQTAMRHFNIVRRKAVVRSGKFTGENSAQWKGGRVLQGKGQGEPSPYSDRGYWYIWNPDHPNATKSGYVAEHIAVATEKIGRTLEKGECVHHKDLNKHNNDPDNLYVCTKEKHGQLHRQLELIAIGLYRRGLVVFDDEQGYILVE